MVFADNNVIAGTGAKIRVYHLSPGTGSARVSTQSSTIVNNISYANASPYISLSSGTYAFTLNADAQNAALSSQVTLKPWSVMSIFAVGLVQGNPHWRLVATQQQGIPGMPQTGSDPHAVVESYPLAWPLYVLVVSLICLVVGCVYVLARIRSDSSAAKKQEKLVAAAGYIEEG
ncbi:DUF4397 domain-containing protein [Dictyobacter kobayashii]|uniref:DUF4397 domain-containing protein n=1 Tax=Dictyobacter kobayashii TaxID=2014872 RepID=A0A402AKV7_9CHLR|nr:DUF4397 domain-containing protein [Dictyobacter kobayashii]GCE19756.1 hypothetical protein KDK_35560 [Dictyobacter kobayashii]